MFTWICPTCGREVPPKYDECPDCAAKAKAAASPPPASPGAAPRYYPPTPQPQGAPYYSGPPTDPGTGQPYPAPPPPAAAPYYPPPPPAAPPYAPPPPQPYAPPAYAPPPPPPVAAPPYTPPQPPAAATPAPASPPTYTVPPPSTGLPTWLLTIIFAIVFAGLGVGIYYLVHYFSAGGQTATRAPIIDGTAAKTPGKEHPMQQYVEVTGIRFIQNARKDTEARFVVINHSGAEIADLAGTVKIFGRTDKAQEEAAGTFAFRVPSIGPFDSKEQTALVKTKLKAYELPDWQNVTATVELTSP